MITQTKTEIQEIIRRRILQQGRIVLRMLRRLHDLSSAELTVAEELLKRIQNEVAAYQETK